MRGEMGAFLQIIENASRSTSGSLRSLANRHLGDDNGAPPMVTGDPALLRREKKQKGSDIVFKSVRGLYGLFLFLAAFFAALSVATVAQAETWPSRVITIIVPFDPGGSTDVPARLIAKDLSERLGQPVIVENKAGAGGITGTISAAKANPDGYTFLLTASGPAVYNKLLYKSIQYDTDKDFAPVIITNDVPQVLTTRDNLPVKSVKELVDYASKNGPLTLGYPGPGTTGHLAGVLFVAQTGINATLVPYRGSAPLVTDLIGRHVDFSFPSFVPPLKTLNMLGVTTDAPVSFLQGVPTVRESGVADVIAATWNAIYAPAGTPRDIVDKMNAAVNAYLKTDAAQQQFAAIGSRTRGGSPEDLLALMAQEKEKWGKVIRDAKISLDDH